MDIAFELNPEADFGELHFLVQRAGYAYFDERVYRLEPSTPGRQMQIHHFLDSLPVVCPQRQKGTQKTRLFIGLIGRNDGYMIGSECFDFQIAEDTCRFFERRGEHREEEIFSLVPV
jgi:hypothetical protein